MKSSLSAIIAALALVACGESSKPANFSVASGTAAVAVVPSPKVLKIALVMKTLTNPFFIEMEKGARRAETELKVELQVRTAAQETSIEQQIQIVNDLIAAHVDAIVIAPGDSTSLIPVLQKAAAAGIKLVNIDNRLNPQALQQAGLAPLPFISVDNEKAAYAAAHFIADAAPRAPRLRSLKAFAVPTMRSSAWPEPGVPLPRTRTSPWWHPRVPTGRSTKAMPSPRRFFRLRLK